MSPYDTQALRELGDELPEEFEDLILQKGFEGPLTASQAQRQERENPDIILADGISPEDCTYFPQPAVAEKQSEIDWEAECAWCNKQWKKDVKLLASARHGDLELVMTAVEEGANVTCFDITYNSWSPLHHASFYGHAEMAERLIDLGAEVNQVDDTRWTPLHYAALKGHTDVCNALLNCGADVMMLTEKNKTALQKAVYMHHKDTTELLCDWMGVPSENFTADNDALDEETIKRTLDIEAEEMQQFRDVGLDAAQDAQGGQIEHDATEVPDGVVQEDRTFEDEQKVAELKAEYDRRFRAMKNAQGKLF